MTDDQPPITGPIPVYVRTTPVGVVLDLAALRDLIVGDVIDELLNADDTTAWDLLHSAADPETAGELDGELLQQHLTERASSRIPLYGTTGLDLAQRIRVALGPRAVPQQRRTA
ncbi:hypothetical protein [Streptomyces clavifer]|uniref:hypothetical protein n=1 Tax=Streptomyces clavifer TaxID=68188 RepID=UPI00308D4CD8|nr:hypothetical protein OG388_26850 [Streptomyces clavifer]